ncbi:hypothetical protein GCM10017566_29580 [Amycolatopsis bartoniae]|uniref:Uncharacterized protein n=1 Tax=Amycolatopsis bartoniae TaxID=941986 RepID=A0A8H9IUE9_9PSEU|nr:hypothetical protein GCM10017566_29580 [Amycolatopsis bartoniae]
MEFRPDSVSLNSAPTRATVVDEVFPAGADLKPVRRETAERSGATRTGSDGSTVDERAPAAAAGPRCVVAARWSFGDNDPRGRPGKAGSSLSPLSSTAFQPRSKRMRR